MRILLVDDDPVLAKVLADQLTAQRYTVDVATDGEAGWRFARSTSYELMVLDVNLPKLNGIDLCQRLRQQGYHQPILLLTAKGDSADKVMGLDAGADDYVVKPCTVAELCARIRALLRRQSESNTPILKWGDLCLNPSRCEVTYGSELVALSAKEYSLLELLLRHPQRVFSSSNILDHLWGFEEAPGEEAVRTLIKRSRQKLKATGAENVIETVYGIGYRLTPHLETQPSAADRARTAALEVWEKFKQPTLERLAVIEQAVAVLEDKHLSEALRSQAEQAAHKLTGSLGMFGLAEGSRLSREIEQGLQAASETRSFRLLKTLVDRLQQEIQQFSEPSQSQAWTDRSAETIPDQSLPKQSLPKQLPPKQSLSLVLWVTNGEQSVTQPSQIHSLQIQPLQIEGKNCGIQVDVVASVAEAKTRIAQQMPDAILLDLSFAPALENGLLWLEELTVQVPQLPVLVLSASNDFGDRLQIARRSRHRFISSTAFPHDILAIVRDILNCNRLDQTKILAVDDDPLTLELLQQMLGHQGIHLLTLDDPQQFWHTLNTIAPDLLILDIEMPEVNGIELCRVVRSDRAWDQLPILILTAHKDAGIIQQLFSAGADDYLSKPFTEPEIIARICNRLQRQRLLGTTLHR